MDSPGLIVCGNHNGLDFARYDPDMITNVQSPRSSYKVAENNDIGFKMEFWFLTQSYYNNNFDNILLLWNKHLKISINQMADNYTASCYALSDLANPLTEGIPSTMDYGNIQNKWGYVVCGANLKTKQYYVSIGRVTHSKNFSPSQKDALANTISSKVILQIGDYSPTNFGFAYIRELRLWNCYNCYFHLAYVPYTIANLYFNNVLHYFKMDDPLGNIVDTVGGVASTTAKQKLTQRTDFIGYSVMKSLPKLPNCDEGVHNYFNFNANINCDVMYNLNRLNDVEFPNIPVARTNRWTMEFWVFVEGANDFTKGINVIYENHISISLLALDINTKDITTFCLPQAYRNKVWGLSGNDAYLVYQGAQNRAFETLTGAFSQWNYLRCAFDSDRDLYYYNNKPEAKILPEAFYTDILNVTPFKFFSSSTSKVSLVVQNGNINNTRIFFRTLNIYREYIPQSFDFKYRIMKLFSTLNYYPLVISTDFADYNNNYGGLMYNYNEYETEISTLKFNYNFLKTVLDRTYTTYPFYTNLILCNVSQKFDGAQCVDITSLSTCDNKSVFCLDDYKNFWCVNGINSWLDLNSNTCSVNCPTNATRPTDGLELNGMCSYTCANPLNPNMIQCPNLKNNMTYANFQLANAFVCGAGTIRVYQKCISKDRLNLSAFYFSWKYSFSNTVADFTSVKNLKEYFIEFYIKLDTTFPAPKDGRRYTYFIGYPHVIIRTEDDYTFSYANAEQNNGNNVYKLNNGFHPYEWNRVIIECYIDARISTYITNIYINNNYATPNLTVNLSSVAYDLTLKEISFCNGIYTNNIEICNFHSITPLWGSAFYKQIRVWDFRSSSLFSIIDNENKNGLLTSNNIYTDNLISYHKMTYDKINQLQIVNEISSPSLDFLSTYFYSNNYDNNVRVNFANNFDISGFQDGNYLSYVNVTYLNSTNQTEIQPPIYTMLNCDKTCKRCYSGKPNDCYECPIQQFLIGKKCYQYSNYYFKVPTNDNVTFYKLKNQPISDGTQIINDLTKANPYTITFFMKFLGIKRKH